MLCAGYVRRRMDTVLAWRKWQTYLVYLDDIVVFSTSSEEHLSLLRRVVEYIRSKHLTVKPENCQLGFEELKFLTIVSAAGIRTHTVNKTAIASSPRQI